MAAAAAAVVTRSNSVVKMRADDDFRDLLEHSAYAALSTAQPHARAAADLPVCIDAPSGVTLTQAELFVLYQSEFSFAAANDDVTLGNERVHAIDEIACVRPFIGACNDMLECVLLAPLLFVCGEERSPTFRDVYADVAPAQRAEHLATLPAVNDVTFQSDVTNDDADVRASILDALRWRARERLN